MEESIRDNAVDDELAEIMEQCSLTEDKAEEYMTRYWDESDE